MTYADDLEIIKNTGRAIGATVVDLPVAAVQDAVNIYRSMRANVLNNIASKEEWKERFENFWSDAWNKEGGIKDMLIDLKDELLDDIFGRGENEPFLNIKFKTEVIDSQVVEFFENFGWRDWEGYLYKNPVDLLTDDIVSNELFLKDIIKDRKAFNKEYKAEEHDNKVEFKDLELINYKVNKKVRVYFENQALYTFTLSLKKKSKERRENSLFEIKPQRFVKRNISLKKELDSVLLWVLNNSLAKSSKPTITPKTEEYVSKRITSNSQSIKHIYDAGPLLFSNMFDVALVVLPRSATGKPIQPGKETILFLRNMLDSEGTISKVADCLFKTSDFSVRNASVSIPMVNQPTFQTQFLESKVERAASIIEFSNQASLQIDMDANLYYSDFFQALAGHRNSGKFDGAKKTILETHAAAISGHSLYELDVVVTSRTLHKYGKYTVNPTPEGGKYSNICYVFKDVRFLGGGNIEFNKTSSNNIQCEYEFLFRNVYHLYKSNTSFITHADKKDNLKITPEDAYYLTDAGKVPSSINSRK